MHHKLDNDWNNPDDYTPPKSAHLPGFHKSMVAHYTERLAQVTKNGIEYNHEYFFVLNQLRYHKKHC